MEILKHGNKCIKTTCKQCNCVFQFLYKEVKNYYRPYGGFSYQTDYDYINCPECGEKIILEDRSIEI